MARRATDREDQGNGSAGDPGASQGTQSIPAVAAARARPVSNRPRDSELSIMAEIMRRYALLPPEARLRVHRYVSERLDSLPVIAAVGGGAADDHQPQLFDATAEAA